MLCVTFALDLDIFISIFITLVSQIILFILFFGSVLILPPLRNLTRLNRVVDNCLQLSIKGDICLAGQMSQAQWSFETINGYTPFEPHVSAAIEAVCDRL